MGTKYCSDCRKDRPVSAFGKNARSKDGLSFYCKEHTRARMRASYLKHRDTRIPKMKEYYSENKERMNAQNKEWRTKNEVYVKKARKAYEKKSLTYHANRRKYYHSYKHLSKDVRKEARQRRRARERGNEHIPYKRVDVFVRDRWICQLCLKPVDSNLRPPSPLAPSIDHVIPLSIGGPDSIDNVQLAHLGCNNRRSRK